MSCELCSLAQSAAPLTADPWVWTSTRSQNFRWSWVRLRSRNSVVRLTDRRYMTEILLLWHKIKTSQQINQMTRWCVLGGDFFFCERTAAIKRHLFTFKHHTDVILSNLQHRFFLSAFGSETVIRDRRDRSVKHAVALYIYCSLNIKEAMVDRTHKLFFTWFVQIPIKS